MMQMLQMTLMIIQQAAPKNIVMERFQNVSEKVEAIKLNPPIIPAHVKMQCKLNFCTKYLTANPPTTYPTALHKKMKE